MKIFLNNYGIKALDVGLCVYKNVTRTKKGTNDTYTDEEIVGYYGTLPSALIGLLKYEMNSSEANTIKQLVDDYKKLEKQILQEVQKCKLN